MARGFGLDFGFLCLGVRGLMRGICAFLACEQNVKKEFSVNLICGFFDTIHLVFVLTL